MAVPLGEGVQSRTPFVLFWFSRVLSTLASQTLMIALQWHVYRLTGSALDLGLVGLAQFLPVVLLTLVIGHVADRYDRRRIAGICQFIEAVSAALIAIGTYGSWLDETGIFALVALLSAARAFESPTMAALLPGVVERSFLQRATAWSASANQAAQIIGPAIGGFLYAVGGPETFAVAAIAFLLAALMVTLIRVRPVVRPPVPLSVASLFSGLGFIRRDRLIFGTLSLDLFAVLLGGVVSLLPIFAQDILHVGSFELGLLRSAPAVGALLMSVVLGRFAMRDHVGRWLFAAVASFGVATIVFALSTSFLLSLLALAALGASDVVSVVIRSSLVQLRTPDEMRGRVSAINSLFIGASNQLGDFESGLVASLVGAVPAALIGGCGTILVAGVWMLLFPELRRVRTLEG